MAKPAWLTPSPTTGRGNGSVSCVVPAYTGRTNRTGTITVTTAGSKTATVSVTQTGKALFVTAGSNKSAAATGTTATVTFTTNAEKFKITPGSGATVSSVKANNTAVTASSGIYTPSGDPGSSAQYTVEVVVTFSANTTITSRTFTVKCEDSATASISGTVTITQAAGASTISVSPTTLTFSAAGETKSFTVTSNDSWTVS